MITEPIEVGGSKYLVGKLDAFKQLHVARRLAPVLTGMKEAIQAMEGGQGVMAAVEPFSRCIAAISDADAEYIIHKCLGVVQREQPGGTGWANVMSSGGIMFKDIELPQMLELVWHVLEKNLLSFFPELPSALNAGVPKAS